VNVERPVDRGGRHRIHGVVGNRSDRVNRGSDLGVLIVRQAGEPLRPSLGVTIAKSKLLGAEGLTDPACEIASVEKRETEPRPPGGLTEHLAHLVRVGVGMAVWLVVQIMELAHRGKARHDHLGIGGGGQFEISIRIEPVGDPVHLLAPGPEGPAGVGAAAEGAMEGVGVGIGQTGQDGSLQNCGPVLLRANRDAGDHTVVAARDLDRPLGGSPDKRVFAPKALHAR
jgi:hypothetical protein